ncbi:MAG: DMT family transporter [Kiloniellaceae bacterium]
MTQLIEQTAASSQGDSAQTESHPLGAWLVFGSAFVWSLGGILARLAEVDNPWTTIFWRAGTATLFLLAFMLLRDGRAGTVALFARMGVAGLGVAACFAIASTSFVVALQFTTVANVLLMQAGVPLIAALISRVLFGEPLRLVTGIAIAAVIAGVAVMVSDSLTGRVSPVGDGLALLIAFAFATATVITRRKAGVRMTPAVCTGSAIGCAVALGMSLATAGSVAVEIWQLPILGVFGVSLGLGMALFAQGARLIPSAFAALLGTAETILGPFWVWLFLEETPTPRTIVGGAIVLAAILAYLTWQIASNRRIRRLAPPAL